VLPHLRPLLGELSGPRVPSRLDPLHAAGPVLSGVRPGLLGRGLRTPGVPPGVPIVTQPGQCCGVCASAPTCGAGLDAFLAPLITKLDALSCQSSTDCVIVSLGGACKLDCGTAVNAASKDQLIQAAASHSGASCSTCPQTNMACPPVVYSPVCSAGQCVLLP